MSSRSDIRLAAVQHLYQLAMDNPAETPENPDPFFIQLTEGVPFRQEAIDEHITRHLKEGWRLERLSPLQRVILEAATFELMALTDTPAKVIISEYVAMTEQFFDKDEVRFSNGILQSLADTLRSGA